METNSYGLPDEPAFYDEVDSMLRRRYYVTGSAIHGEGVFASRDLEPGDVIGVLHEIVMVGLQYRHSLLGLKINHSDTPNCVLVTHNNKRYAAPLNSIRKDEELTLNYDWCPPDLEKKPQ